MCGGVRGCACEVDGGSKGGEGITTSSSFRPRQSVDWAKGRVCVCVCKANALCTLYTVLLK